jgi:CubicO group peptidase (beta-lactamase class C family)
MKKIVNYCILLTLSGSCCVTPVAGQSVTETIDELLKAYSAQGAFNGTALVAQKNRVLFQKGYGYRNPKTKTLNDSNSIFQISSLTKQFTAVLILRLQEKKLLSLQDRISKYLPSFPHADQINIENLLTHTSGIFNYTNDSEMISRGWIKPIRTDSLVAFFRDKPLDFQPGATYRYSNSGYILLGYIIEKITGKSYFDLMREEIFLPLHMDHTGFDFKTLRDPGKSIGPLGLSGNIADSSLLYAAGAMYSCTGDLYKWDRALYTGQLLQDSSLQKAFTPFKGKYGYGWVIDSTYGNKILMQEGGIFDFVSFMARVPADQTCIILLDNNQSQGLAKIGEDIYAVLNDQPFDWPKQRATVRVDTSILRQYTGVYRFAPDFSIRITLENGHLLVQAGDQDKVELFAEKENLFFTKFLVTELEFYRDANGKVINVTLYQADHRIPGKKIN